MTIYFDMDGTIADLYSVPNWLAMLEAADPTPYMCARPLVNLSRLAYYLNRLQERGYKIGIISWTSKHGTESYNALVYTAKMYWLKAHMPSVKWDDIKIVNYGTNKYQVCGGGILFDDEEHNRNDWKNEAYTPEEIFSVLMNLMRAC